MIKFAKGELTYCQVQALKTAIMSFPGFIDKSLGKEEEVNKALIWLKNLQDKIGVGWSIFGFAYSQGAEAFYTKQDSMQSYFGFGDIYDKAGSALGMDLDTEVVQFTYDGKEYRFQVWKGIYGSGTLAGGEQGWYVYDPSNSIEAKENSFADKILQEDWVPVAVSEDRIRMVNTIFDVKTNSVVAGSSDTDTNLYGENAYWNLCTSAKSAGYAKSELWCHGELYIEDEGLRNKLYIQLMENPAFENVKETRTAITYDWKDMNDEGK